jgi:hypothetical protein
MMPKVSAAPEIKNDSTWNDRDYLVGFWSDAKASLSVSQFINNSICCSQSIRAPTRETNGIDLVDKIHWGESVGFARARTSATNINSGGNRVLGENDRGAGSPITI